MVRRLKLSNEDKLKIFESIENHFESVISILCSLSGTVLKASESLRQILPDFVEGKSNIFAAVSKESRDALEKVLEGNDSRIIHFISPDDMIETFVCIPVMVSCGIYIYCVRQKTHPGTALFEQTKQQNAVFQMLLNRIVRNENLLEELHANCGVVEDFFRVISKSLQDLNKLTPRELQIFLLLKDYPDRNKLSEFLELSINTIDVHLTSVYKKINKHSIEELIELSASVNRLIKESDINQLIERISRNIAIIQTLMIDERRTRDLSLLTARELQIIVMLFQNKSNKQIADAFFLSVNTVKSHITRIFKKLGISSRSELKRY